MESWLLAQQAEIEAIKTEVLGMVASNQDTFERESYVAYTDRDFQQKADELRSVATCIMQNR